MKLRVVALLAGIAACGTFGTGDDGKSPAVTQQQPPPPDGDAGAQVVAEAGAPPDGAPVATAPTDPYAKMIIADGATGYWRMHVDASGQIANEIDSNAPLTRALGTVAAPATGVLGSAADLGESEAVHFDGGLYFILQKGDPYDFDGAQDFTLECWVSWEPGNGTETVLASATDGAQSNIIGYSFGMNFGSQTAFLYGTRDRNDVAVGPTASTGWHHLAVVVRDGATATVYLDGAAGGATPLQQQPDNVRPFSVAGRSSTNLNTNAAFFRGSIDEVAVYDKALSTERITAHFAQVKAQ